MNRPLGPRTTPSLLSSPTNQRLRAYALVASAAGVAALALVSPAEAEIVYTPADQTVGRQGTYSLDLNHDGIVDYILAEHAVKDTSFATFQVLSMKAPTGNHVQCVTSDCISTFIYAAALRSGSQIKSAHQRGWCFPGGAEMAFEILFERSRSPFYSDAWANVSDRYLGLWFQINGENHYGWARLTVKFHPGRGTQRTWEAHLTGYAYETVADKTITAGQTTEDKAGLTPSSCFTALGALALGTDGLALWRREETLD